jgi:hypothetical protein
MGQDRFGKGGTLRPARVRKKIPRLSAPPRGGRKISTVLEGRHAFFCLIFEQIFLREMVVTHFETAFAGRLVSSPCET